MAGVEYRPAQPEDAVHLLADLRLLDRQELEATSDRPLIDTVLLSLRVSRDPLAAFDPAGRLLCILGVAPFGLLSDTAAPWLLGTNALRRWPKALLGEARRYIDWAHREYPRLTNHVDARNRATVGWLKRIGFAIDAPEPFGVQGRPFHRFHMGFDNV